VRRYSGASSFPCLNAKSADVLAILCAELCEPGKAKTARRETALDSSHSPKTPNASLYKTVRSSTLTSHSLIEQFPALTSFQSRFPQSLGSWYLAQSPCIRLPTICQHLTMNRNAPPSNVAPGVINPDVTFAIDKPTFYTHVAQMVL
jgi:hypothetical protein